LNNLVVSLRNTFPKDSEVLSSLYQGRNQFVIAVFDPASRGDHEEEEPVAEGQLEEKVNFRFLYDDEEMVAKIRHNHKLRDLRRIIKQTTMIRAGEAYVGNKSAREDLTLGELTQNPPHILEIHSYSEPHPDEPLLWIEEEAVGPADATAALEAHYQTLMGLRNGAGGGSADNSTMPQAHNSGNVR